MKATILKQSFEAKIPNNGYSTKEEMRVKEIAIVKEILELEEVKSCLNHFMASHNSKLYAATACDAKAQMSFVWENLKVMYTELKEIRAMLAPRVYEPKVIDLAYNDDEIRAIQSFNSDRRFRINE